MNDDKVFTGVVIFFCSKKGYGFLAVEGEKDLFCHYSDIVSEGFRTLKKDDKVSFKKGLNVRGMPKAIEVTVI